LPLATNSNCLGPVISKEDGNGAPSRAHSDSKSIVSAHISRNADLIGGLSSDMEVSIRRRDEHPFAAVRNTKHGSLQFL
jgi:hypothetical protein